ncbi:glycerate kinase [Actinopolyspora xinjiangensis]|uniref:Glycerate kinase n=1 Tax=Actinopolyspora xinjiangensis TaxID=405564 RepID=A0A1H0RWZ1_9ACTN|nr:glycerate kinase [Actinopolyspora xinjiangensis]SDP34004.1 glycerate kinase [Actinopolyspora xinjiangensis]
MRVLAAPDKFRGSANAAEVASAIADAARSCGLECLELPLADGGEGTLDAFGGPNRWSEVTGPLGERVRAGWRLDPDGRAVVEMARASGLTLVGGAEGNSPERASSSGTGELIAAALREGAQRVLVGMGGSATTDGGAGAVEVLAPFAPLNGGNGRPEVLACCDVDTVFPEAARVFGPQKGVGPERIEYLTARLHELAASYRHRFGVDVSSLTGGGAAGGLAGGLAALGARPVSGFDTISRERGLHALLDTVDLVVTGEGKLDLGSFGGKVVGGVAREAWRHDVEVLAVVGTASAEAAELVPIRDVSAEFGRWRAWHETTECVRRCVIDRLTTG